MPYSTKKNAYGGSHAAIPTEAQLRWAQFHKKKRAKETKMKVQSLMSHPVSEREVDGATTEDGESSCSSSNDSGEENKTYNKKKKKSRAMKKDKAKVSRGRRAVLRVSARAYENRKRGGRYEPRESKSSLDESNEGARRKNGHKDEDFERVKRFEDAYNAMMCMSSTDNEDQTLLSMESSKKWKRSPRILRAISVDGREYDDLQRTPSIKHHGKHTPKSTFSGTLTPAARVNIETMSPGKDEFMEILTKLQRSVSTSETKKNNSRQSSERKKLDWVKEHHQKEKKETKKEVNQSLSSKKSRNRPETRATSTSRTTNYSPINPHLSFSSDSFESNESTESPCQFSPAQLKNLTNFYSPTIESDMQSDVYIRKRESVMDLNLSPTIISKRLRQAIRATEGKQWDKVGYLLNANPWLAEMTDLINSQLLLHHLALHGLDAPNELHELLIDKYPKGVPKFDKDGNLPLHMAARAGNTSMVVLLGEEFSAGASVRNNDGFLPIHLAVQSECFLSVETCLRLFPAGVSVRDNNGNLPLHLAARIENCEIVRMLVENDKGVRSIAIRHVGANIELGGQVSGTEMETEDNRIKIVMGGLVTNRYGETPLVMAIKCCSGSEVVEALMNGAGGEQAATRRDSNGQNILHTALSPPYNDPVSILAILKINPQLASIPNPDGILPIELACMQDLPREVIIGFALVDLPIDINDKDSPSVLPGRGSSWWYLVCDCEDAHSDIVGDILSLCSYHQMRHLCFLKSDDRNGSSVISSATPKCKANLRKALRFVGRYEFVGSVAVKTNLQKGLKVFDAIDFQENDKGRKVWLKCFGRESSYEQETQILYAEFDDHFVECIDHFSVHEYEAYSSENAPKQFCVAVEKPDLTLAKVIAGMPKDHEYRSEPDRFLRYLGKVCTVLRLIGKAVKHLHEKDVIHGDLGPHNVGKFGERWKLMDITQAQKIGGNFSPSRPGCWSPPEAIKDGVLQTSIKATTALDVWAFGKLMYEIFVGESLIQFDQTKKITKDLVSLRVLEKWDKERLDMVAQHLTAAGISSLGVDLVTHCLSARAEERPKSFSHMLKHPFWKVVKRKGPAKTTGVGKNKKDKKKVAGRLYYL